MAHKKGGGSTKNGRDSISKRLGAKKSDGQKSISWKHINKTKRNKNASRFKCWNWK